jgi:hypothetical protein
LRRTLVLKNVFQKQKSKDIIIFYSPNIVPNPEVSDTTTAAMKNRSRQQKYLNSFSKLAAIKITR